MSWRLGGSSQVGLSPKTLPGGPRRFRSLGGRDLPGRPLLRQRADVLDPAGQPLSLTDGSHADEQVEDL